MWTIRSSCCNLLSLGYVLAFLSLGNCYLSLGYVLAFLSLGNCYDSWETGHIPGLCNTLCLSRSGDFPSHRGGGFSTVVGTSYANCIIIIHLSFKGIVTTRVLIGRCSHISLLYTWSFLITIKIYGLNIYHMLASIFCLKSAIKLGSAAACRGPGIPLANFSQTSRRLQLSLPSGKRGDCRYEHRLSSSSLRVFKST